MKHKETKKRDDILRESFKLFLLRGYDAVSLTDIERAAKVTRGAIFHHFENKEDLFKNVADRFVYIFLEDMDFGKEYIGSSAPLKVFMDKCLSAIENRMKYFQQQTDGEMTTASFMRFILYLKDHYDAWGERIQTYEEHNRAVCMNVINLSKDKGEISPDVDALMLTETLHNIYLGFSYKGAATDRMSISDLKKIWEYIYRQQLKN